MTHRLVNAIDELIDAMHQAMASRDPRRPWTDAEAEIMRDYYPIAPAAVIAEALGRKRSAVYQKAQNMGLYKSDEYLNSPLSGRAQFDDRGRQGRFRKGLTPWNKGKKGWDAGGRCAETRFRKGQKPHNTQPVGTVVEDPGGYLKKKTRDGLRPTRHCWQFVHVLVWEQHHGPVPDGMNVVFRNGNKQDTRIDNLELISDADLMRRNTRHRYPKEINDAIAVKAALTRRINNLQRTTE